MVLELRIAHAMNLYWAWICLFLVEIFTEKLWKHFVDAHVSQKQIIVSQKLAFVFELPKVSLKSIKANDFCNAWDFHILNGLFKVCFWILNKHTNARVEFVRVEWLWHVNLKRSWSWSLWNLSQGE